MSDAPAHDDLFTLHSPPQLAEGASGSFPSAAFSLLIEWHPENFPLAELLKVPAMTWQGLDDDQAEIVIADIAAKLDASIDSLAIPDTLEAQAADKIARAYVTLNRLGVQFIRDRFDG